MAANPIRKTDIDPPFLQEILNQYVEVPGGSGGEADITTNRNFAVSDKGLVLRNYAKNTRSLVIPLGLPLKWYCYIEVGQDSTVIIDAVTGVTAKNLGALPVMVKYDSEINQPGLLKITNSGVANEYYFISDRLDFNEAPRVEPQIIGAAAIGTTLTLSLNYNDRENDPEGTHSYQWLSGTSANSLTPITGATSGSLTLTSTHLNRFIACDVTPRATSGTMVGNVTRSNVVGPVSGEVAYKLDSTIQIDFARYRSDSDNLWNKIITDAPNVGLYTNTLVNRVGVTLAYSVEITTDFAGGNENDQSADHPRFPRATLRSSLRSDGSKAGTIRIGNLNNATKKFNIIVIGSTTLTQDGVTRVSSQGKSGTYDARNNTSNVVTLTDLVPQGSGIEILVEAVTTYGFISAMIIEQYGLA